MQTKKDFQQWADVLARWQSTINRMTDDHPDRQRVYEWWAEEVVDILRQSNPRFDAERFQQHIDNKVRIING